MEQRSGVSSLDWIKKLSLSKKKNIYLKDKNRRLRFENRMLKKAKSELMMQIQKIENNEQVQVFFSASPEESDGMSGGTDHIESVSSYYNGSDREQSQTDFEELINY